MTNILPVIADKLWDPGVCRGRVDATPDAVYLSFDDGPAVEATPALLDILAEHAAYATFFVNLIHARENPFIIRRMLSDGHAIGTHGYNHRSLIFASRRQIEREMESSARELSDICGRRVTMFRPPYGRIGMNILRVARESGMKIVLWSRSAADWKPASAERLIKRLSGRLRPRDIVLLHDAGPFARRTIAAVPGIIEDIKAAGMRPDALEL